MNILLSIAKIYATVLVFSGLVGIFFRIRKDIIIYYQKHKKKEKESEVKVFKAFKPENINPLNKIEKFNNIWKKV